MVQDQGPTQPQALPPAWGEADLQGRGHTHVGQHRDPSSMHAPILLNHGPRAPVMPLHLPALEAPLKILLFKKFFHLPQCIL